jgi:hypothetical protein
METKWTVLKLSMKVFSPSIVTLVFLIAISTNSMIGLAKSDIPNEITFYENVSGMQLESSFPWPDFKELDGYFLRVSRQGLRKESFKVLNTLGICRIFVDTNRGVMWITGFMRIRIDEPTMFVYYWVDPSGGSEITIGENLKVGTI